MNTQTHLLIAGALLARPAKRGGTPARNAAVIAGALAPDAGVYGLFAWSKLAGVPEREVWRSVYFAEPMQTIQAVLNSAPVYAFVFFIAMLVLSPRGERAAKGAAPRTSGWWGSVDVHSALGLLAIAALLHLAGDLPVHADDAHRHFWPLTDWRFHSPISYWDPAHGGNWFAWIEAALGISCAVLLWRRFRAGWVRVLLALAVVAYLAVPLYFTLALGAWAPTGEHP